MSYSEVIVITPDNLKYKAEVDLEAEDHAILSGLVSKTKLPMRDHKGRPIKYRLSIIGATRLSPGGTIKIEREEPPVVGDVTPFP